MNKSQQILINNIKGNHCHDSVTITAGITCRDCVIRAECDKICFVTDCTASFKEVAYSKFIELYGEEGLFEALL